MLSKESMIEVNRFDFIIPSHGFNQRLKTYVFSASNEDGKDQYLFVVRKSIFSDKELIITRLKMAYFDEEKVIEALMSDLKDSDAEILFDTDEVKQIAKLHFEEITDTDILAIDKTTLLESMGSLDTINTPSISDLINIICIENISSADADEILYRTLLLSTVLVNDDI